MQIHFVHVHSGAVHVSVHERRTDTTITGTGTI